MKITTKHAVNSHVTFVTNKRFAVLAFLPSCCVNSLKTGCDGVRVYWTLSNSLFWNKQKSLTHHDGVWVSLYVTCKVNKTWSVNKDKSCVYWEFWNSAFRVQCANYLSEKGQKSRVFWVLGRVAPSYKPYRYVPPHRVGFLRRFGLKTGIHFAHFGLESGMVFEGTTECMNVFIVSIPNK